MLMTIGRNLWDFLYLFSLRCANPANAPLIWIDAVCINQDNILERNHQVALMHNIYRDAESVIVWLGPDLEGAELAFELAQGKAQLAVDYEMDIRGCCDSEQWQSLENLLSRRYWRRVWIVQEFIIAREVYIWCGILCAGISGLDHICRTIEINHTHGAPLPQEAFNILKSPGWRLFKDRGGSYRELRTELTLQYLVESYSEQECRDIRDKVYGLLGLASDAFGIAPDYRKSPVQLLAEIIEHQCQQGTINGGEELHNRVTHWARILGVAHSELAGYIMNESQLPGARLSIPAPGEFVSTPLQYVCEVRATGYDTKIEGRPDWLYESPTSDREDEMYTTNYPTLDAGIHCLVLPDKQNDLEDPRFRPMLENIWISTEPKLQMEGQKPFCYLRTFDCQKDFHTVSKERGPVWVDGAGKTEPACFWGLDQTAVFVGSNRIVGVFDRRIQVRPYDRIYTIAGVARVKRALIVRGDSNVGLWKTVGCALLLRQESKPWLEWYDPVLHETQQAVSPRCPDGESLPQDPELDVVLSCSVAHAPDILRYLSPDSRCQVEPTGTGDRKASNEENIGDSSHIDSCRHFKCMQQKEWNRILREDSGPTRLKHVRADSVTDVVEYSEVSVVAWQDLQVADNLDGWV